MKNYLYLIYWIYRTLPLRWNFPKYKVMTFEETVNDLVNNKKSIARFGDGEFILLLKERDLGFQKLDIQLADKLAVVLNNRNPKLLVAVPHSIVTTKNHKRFAKVHWLMFINTYGDRLSKFLSVDYHYGNANMTRPYAGAVDQSQAQLLFDKLRAIWNKQDILIVEGDLSRLGVGNDLFDNANSLKRIICPGKNTFDRYDQIKNATLKLGENNLILCALGPTATVLCSDLCDLGYWAIDIGHIDIEYMWMLMDSKGRTSVKGRYVHESHNTEGYELDPEFVAPYKESILLDLSL
ncbi:DUF1792 domain-containing protein [Flavobacterium sp. F-380]|uniref:DUF1792 domain-containing protein n=1 Tax=Flavobacterium kayseriense TaxID=2764714 RepID=A0ABR7J821_9FLAO|nr:GT-D fold domain-containing glycosyltransferase [Flavobacterium kayseriense]MBC5841479.1 DUF1792 domain-containing protein [Flavobacterium kayseriense]MBC5848007.1 DUF1792 domain-containing protein [Flavobacterium kayseriense]